jgi:hypothetical protein
VNLVGVTLLEDQDRGKSGSRMPASLVVARSNRRRNSSKWLNAHARGFVHPDGEVDTGNMHNAVSIQICMPRATK